MTAGAVPPEPAAWAQLFGVCSDGASGLMPGGASLSYFLPRDAFATMEVARAWTFAEPEE